MTTTSLLRPLMAGILHSFEPDHVTAVSVLATEKAIRKEKPSFITILKASQWALGHSATLLLFGSIAIAFKSVMGVFINNLSGYAEIAVGPIMIWLGIMAIRRNHKINAMLQDHKKIEAHDHTKVKPIHLHGKAGEEIAMNPMNKSFWIGMLHGLAGTGGVLTSALILSADTFMDALLILMVESVGIIVAMGIYSYSLVAILSRFIEKNLAIFKWVNGLAGMLAIILGIIWVYNAI